MKTNWSTFTLQLCSSRAHSPQCYFFFTSVIFIKFRTDSVYIFVQYISQSMVILTSKELWIGVCKKKGGGGVNPSESEACLSSVNNGDEVA